MARKKIEDLEKEEILEQFHELKDQLNRKKSQLLKTRVKLLTAQEKVGKMKARIKYQRDRIIELYREIPLLNSVEQ